MPVIVKGARIADLAKKFREIHERLEALREEKNRVVADLRKNGVDVFDYGDGRCLLRVTCKHKQATLGNLSVLLGKKEAEKVWAKLPESRSDYYTVQNGKPGKK